MPIYEYQCHKCQHRFEEWVKLADAHGQEPCPKCGTPAPRIMSHTSFVLKGGGWYVSDYGYRKGIKEDGSSATAAASDSGSGASGGSAGSAPAASGSAAPAKAASAPAAAPAAPAASTTSKPAPAAS